MKLLGIIRFVGLIFLVVRCITPIFVKSFFAKANVWYGLNRRHKMTMAIIKLLGIEMKVTGKPIQGTYLYVSNHQSYIDPAIILAYIQAMTVTKAEVEQWPLLGPGLKLMGNLFVKRESRKSRLETLQALKEHLKIGVPVLIFPEGTTSTNAYTLPFQLGGFSAAAELGIGVVPIAIKYELTTDCFIGDDVFVEHFLRCFSKSKMKVSAYFGEPIFDTDSKILTDKVKQKIDTALSEF